MKRSLHLAVRRAAFRGRMIRSLMALSVAVLFAATIAAAADVPDVPCAGDCDNDEIVTVSELIRLVSLALGDAQASICSNGAPVEGVKIGFIVKAVLNSVRGCPELGADDCCQCDDFCAAPVNGTCGGCAVYFKASCDGESCVRATRTLTPTPADTPTPTNTPGPTDCCQCPNNCGAPIAGSCGDCTIVPNASCGGGMLCVRE